MTQHDRDIIIMLVRELQAQRALMARLIDREHVRSRDQYLDATRDITGLEVRGG